ncbi:MAG TPA: extracellular solute-binding protein [Candidatus Latescibacteria bacterium]|nr:extracellular solute-binding protein [Candidatus Latescibacterota bacterium]HJP29800.1 extracellular solute-binding protein [Candidatus Latescibacterota bacterium]
MSGCTVYLRMLLLPLFMLALAVPSTAEDLSSIEWVTNMDDPPIGDPAARKGGTFYTSMRAYPLTLRVVGPNANDAFASWKRANTMGFSLVTRHPTTDNYIPVMATHWSIQSDGRTIYYRLDEDARWSDGKPLTAADYVHTWHMMQSENIVDPFFNQYAKDYYEEVVAVEPYVLKVAGKFESWRPLDMFDIWATPQHAVTLEEGFPERYNTAVLPVQGPYVLTEQEAGQFVVFERLEDWWGKDKQYFQGMYNVDRIHIRVIDDNDRAFDFFKKGELSYYTVNTAKKWAEEMEFDAVKKGWAHRKRLFVDYPQGVYGFAMNLEKPIFQNKDFRKAIQYLFNFDEINEKLMYNAYYKQVSAFTGTEYENRDLVPYSFDPRKAREHLRAAGYEKRGEDGILVNAEGGRAAFTLSYGSKGLERHMTVVKQTFQRFGVEMDLRLLEPGTAFRNGLEREYEMTIMSRTSGLFPGPHQYYASVYKETKNNNNVWAFGTAYTDSLIDVYRFDTDKSQRLAAMHELDAIIQDEAFYAPFWQAPFMRFLYWDGLVFPDSFFPKRTQGMTDWQVFWIDEDREARLQEAMAADRSLGEDTVVDVDPYKVKDRIEAALRAAAAR